MLTRQPFTLTPAFQFRRSDWIKKAVRYNGTMSQTKLHLSTAALTEAAETNLVEKSLSFARLPGGEIYGPNPLWFTTGSHLAGYNGVVRGAFSPQDVDECIAAALQPFRKLGLPLTWWTGPSSQPANLGARLQVHGFIHNRDMTGMSAEIEQLTPPSADELLPELRIEEVTSAEALIEWHPIYMHGFGTPPAIAKESLEILGALAFRPGSHWHHFYVRRQEAIVAISSLYISGETAGLYNLVTHSAERGQGIGAAMTLGTFSIARDLGCRIATLQTTYPNALRLYHRLGFEVYCKFGIYQHLKA